MSLFVSDCLQEKFVLCNYMSKQPSLNPEMRAILIDWLVEVQVSFAGGNRSGCECQNKRLQCFKVRDDPIK